MNTQLYPVVILAGGMATRMRPLTQDCPKSLLEVNGEPFIVHQLRLLKKQGITDLVLCLGYLGEQIVDLLGDGTSLDLSLKYSFDGPDLLGTGGAIKKALPLLGDHFFVLYGDSYLQCDYTIITQSYLSQNKQGLMTIFHNQDQYGKSNVEYENGRIMTYDKKVNNTKMQYIDYGLGILSKQVFEQFPDNQSFDLVYIYQQLLHNNQLGSCEIFERFYEIGSKEGLKTLCGNIFECTS